MRLRDLPVVRGIRSGDRKERAGWLLIIAAAVAILVVRVLRILDVLSGRPYVFTMLGLPGALLAMATAVFVSRANDRDRREPPSSS
jgi:hypothetical protein